MHILEYLRTRICKFIFYFCQEHKQELSSSGEHSTPKKLLFWENRSNETQKMEEELMTTRIREMETLTEVKELRLKVIFLTMYLLFLKLIKYLLMKF